MTLRDALHKGQGDQAQRDDGRLRAALAEFEAALEIAADNLNQAIAEALPIGDIVDCEPEPDDEDRVRIAASDLLAWQNEVIALDGAIARGFDDYGWEVARALRQLRREAWR
jgi:hypothetical protein